MSSLSIAFFEPWFGGSHRAFLEAWGARTRHRLAIHALAPRHWKWRQESSAWELAREVDAAAPPDAAGSEEAAAGPSADIDPGPVGEEDSDGGHAGSGSTTSSTRCRGTNGASSMD